MSKRFSKERKQKTNFFVALGVCIVALGVAAFLTYTNSGGNITSQNINTASSQLSSDTGQQVQNNLTSSLNTSQKQSESSESSSSKSKSKKSNTDTQANQTVAQTETLYIYPVGKKVTKPFSNGELVYSLTMNDWRAHDGVDLSADAGSTVKAISDGLVTKIYDDELYGKTVVIEHNDGITAYYSGLGDTVLVKEKENVVIGKEIGSIKSVPCEVLEENHLHLSIKKNDKFIDPLTVLKNAQSDTDSQTDKKEN